LKPNKVYVHHRYSNSLFKRIAHNTTDRVFEVQEEELGIVYCTYKGEPYEFHFVWDLNNYQDGVNYFNIEELKKEYYNRNIRGELFSLDGENVNGYWIHSILHLLKKTLLFVKSYQNWYIDTICGEKIIWYDDKEIKNEKSEFQQVNKVFLQLKNHYILTDNIALNNKILPFHMKYVLTNTIFYWNRRTDILLYYEYGINTHPRLNFEYLFNYNIKRHKIRRLKIGELLNKSYTFVSQTDWFDMNEVSDSNKTGFKKIENSYFNKLYSDVDFYNTYDSYFVYDKVALDMFFRLLPKGQIQILDETHAGDVLNKSTQYEYVHLSEKTYGLILGNIPFIPTNYYPIHSIYKILPNVPPYPFENEIKEYEITPEKFVEFVDIFHNNKEEYTKLLKDWTYEVHKILLSEVETNNSFLDFIKKNSNKKSNLPLI